MKFFHPLLRRGLSLFLFVMLTGGLVMARPQPAYACIWNFAHYFMPWPPCTTEDETVLRRVQALNLQISAKLLTIATKIQQVKTEIRQWQQLYETARNYEFLLKTVWGDITANPLPSMVIAWNQSNFGAYVRLDHQGGLNLGIRPVDFKAQADSIRDAFMNDIDLSRIYDMAAPYGFIIRNHALFTAKFAQDQLRALGDWSRYARIVRDSLQNIGNRTASRYEGVTDVSGEAEAKISHLSIALSKLRGTAFEAQGLAISNRLRTLEIAAEQARLLNRYQPMALSLSIH